MYHPRVSYDLPAHKLGSFDCRPGRCELVTRQTSRLWQDRNGGEEAQYHIGSRPCELEKLSEYAVDNV
jgi:hypothetical protein